MDAILQALASGTRRHILALVWRNEGTAGQIASHFRMSRPGVSQHLAVLLNGNLLVAAAGSAGSTVPIGARSPSYAQTSRLSRTTT